MDCVLLTCPSCAATEFDPTADVEGECRNCGFTFFCSVCGEHYDPRDGDSNYHQFCSDRCAAAEANSRWD